MSSYVTMVKIKLFILLQTKPTENEIYIGRNIVEILLSQSVFYNLHKYRYKFYFYYRWQYWRCNLHLEEDNPWRSTDGVFSVLPVDSKTHNTTLPRFVHHVYYCRTPSCFYL